MALGILAIITVVAAILIISIILLGILKRGDILNKTWYVYSSLILIAIFTYIGFTSLPSNYIGYKFLTIIIGLLGPVSLYLNKIGKLKNDYTLILMLISLIGNFFIGFLL